MLRFYLYHPDLIRPTRIKNDPVGWDTLGKSIKRDPRWHGVFFEYTPKLKFIKDGKNLVHGFYELYGPEAELLLIITRYNPTTKKWDQDYTGRLNLYTLKISTLYAECNVEQTGFIQKLKNRQDVKVNLSSLVTQDGKAIEANAEETQTVQLHSKVIQKQFQLIDASINGFVVPFTDNGTYYIILDLDSATLDEIEERVSYVTHYSTLDPVGVLKYIYKIKEAGSYTFDFDIFAQMSNSPTDVRVKWWFVYGKPGNYVTQQIGATIDFAPFDDGGFIGSFTVNLAVDDEVYFYKEMKYLDESSIEFSISWIFDFSVEITGQTTIAASNAPMVLMHEAWARIVESISDESDSFRSGYYGRTDSEPTSYASDGEGSLRGLLNGSLIRGFPLANKPVHASLKDMIDVCVAIDGVGLGIEKDPANNKERVRVEKLSYFYSPVRVAQFPYVAEIEKEILAERYYNELEAGYDKSLNEEINNLDEFNASREYVLPLSQIKNRLVLKSPYITSGYTIEFLRRDPYKGGSTKDNDRDNDNFIVSLRRSGGDFVTDKNEDFAVLTNVISPETIYNAKLTPMRNIIRNGALIRSGLYHLEGKNIQLTFGEGNTDITTRLTTETDVVSEKAIAVEKLATAIWLPELYLFKHAPTREQWDAINANPYGYIEFSKTDRDWKRGYLLEAAPDPKSNLTDFKLVRANA